MQKYISLINTKSIKSHSLLLKVKERIANSENIKDDYSDYGIININLVSDKPHANQLPTISVKSEIDLDMAESIMLKLCDILHIDHFEILVNKDQHNDIDVTVHHAASLDQARWVAAHNYPNYDTFEAIIQVIEEHNDHAEQCEVCTQCSSADKEEPEEVCTKCSSADKEETKEQEEVCTQCSSGDNKSIDEAGVFAGPAAQIPNLEEVTVDKHNTDLEMSDNI